MSKDNKTRLPELTDNEFLSFLYSERERENNLSQFQGWNNWALAVAIISVICAVYSLMKDNSSLNTIKIIYSTSSIIAFFWAYHSWTWVFRRARGIDFSKVRMMREVMPTVKIVFVFICAITYSILVSTLDESNLVFWLWVSVIIAFSLAFSVSRCYKDKIVPAYCKDMLLPWIWVNAGFESIMGCVFSIIMTQSFKLAGSCILTHEFELGACLSAILVLLYILFSLNFSDKVVRRFDAIMDKYLYAGSTKEETFREISKNRMGYGVLDACDKELMAVETQTKICVEEEKDLDEIKETVLAGEFSFDQWKDYRAKVDQILTKQRDVLNQSRSLLDRLQEIMRASSSYGDVSEIKQVFETNKQCQEKVEAVSEKAVEVSRLLHEKEKEVYTEVISALERIKDEEQDGR